MPFDTTRLAQQVKLKGSLPGGRFTDQELLDFAYDALLSEICPAVLAAREEYFVVTHDYALVAGQASYALPSRAMSGVIREVKLLRDTDIIDLPRVALDEITTVASGQPSRWYVQGNHIVLDPTPDTALTLRCWWYLRPSRLVPTAECAVITAVGASSVTVAIPTGWTAANTFDLIRGRAPYDLLRLDLAASSAAAGVITFTTSVPTTVSVGDYVALAGESCFPALPEEGHVALVQSTITAALESMGDPTAQLSAQKTAALLERFRATISRRFDGGPKTFGRPLF